MKSGNRLVYQGTLLFFLSLLTGLLLVASPSFVANPRGVLAGHLEAAMNGMFVMVVGLFFHRIRLSVRFQLPLVERRESRSRSGGGSSGSGRNLAVRQGFELDEGRFLTG
ncbi:MAG: hypothetical protein ABMA15_21185 [Vicinamibacterales bacterium]